MLLRLYQNHLVKKAKLQLPNLKSDFLMMKKELINELNKTLVTYHNLQYNLNTKNQVHFRKLYEQAIDSDTDLGIKVAKLYELQKILVDNKLLTNQNSVVKDIRKIPLSPALSEDLVNYAYSKRRYLNCINAINKIALPKDKVPVPEINDNLDITVERIPKR